MPKRLLRPARVAIVHDWLTGMRGGEKVLARFCELMPGAEIFTLLHVAGACDAAIDSRRIHTSGLNDLPGVRRCYRHLLPLMPLAIERMDAGRFDLVVSSSHCVAKGIGGRRRGQLHVCYCYSPMRYVWAVAREYEQRLGLSGLALRALRPYLRAWDRRAAGHVDRFIAISTCIAERIRRAYGRPSVVLYPPVDTGFYTPGDGRRDEFYLVVSALAPYKRVDLAMEAFARLGRPLKVIGSGQMMKALRRRAAANVELLGWCDDGTVRDHYRRCRALIFPQLEDFGIVPLEAMACGAPVIAYGQGGARETVLDAANPEVRAPTGLLFGPQTPEALAAAVERFEQIQDRFDPRALRAWARQFGPGRFLEGFRRIVGPAMREHGLRPPWET